MSEENPYEAPRKRKKIKGVRGGSRNDLRNVAKYQKGILTCILVYIVLVICQGAVPEAGRLVLALVGLTVVLTGAVFTFLLSMQVYGTVLGIVFGILALVPLLGLLILLIVNGKATNVLKSNGVHVGFLGADLSSI